MPSKYGFPTAEDRSRQEAARQKQVAAAHRKQTEMLRRQVVKQKVRRDATAVVVRACFLDAAERIRPIIQDILEDWAKAWQVDQHVQTFGPYVGASTRMYPLLGRFLTYCTRVTRLDPAVRRAVFDWARAAANQPRGQDAAEQPDGDYRVQHYAVCWAVGRRVSGSATVHYETAIWLESPPIDVYAGPIYAPALESYSAFCRTLSLSSEEASLLPVLQEQIPAIRAGKRKA
jgi:hypothetical protein